MALAWDYPHPALHDSHTEGATEPWIAEVVSALVKAKGASGERLVVVELGGFVGTTTAWLALTLEKMGGGTLIVSEPDPERMERLQTRLAQLDLDVTQVVLNTIPSPQIIHNFPDKHIDVAWVDNDHTVLHVEQEICALWEKMKPGGLILFHDVSSDGVCNLGPLIRKYGGVALDLPRLGPDGGLGIIRIP